VAQADGLWFVERCQLERRSSTVRSIPAWPYTSAPRLAEVGIAADMVEVLFGVDYAQTIPGARDCGVAVNGGRSECVSGCIDYQGCVFDQPQNRR
jgi:hypothetical protein